MTSTERAFRRALPWAPLILGPVLLFGFELIQGRALFWGAPILQFTPWRTAAKEMILAGHIPAWNPMLGMGAPLLANYQSALLYPPNWLLLATDVSWGQTLLVMLHLIWAGIGMALLVRALGRGVLAQCIAGLAFAMSGYLVARSGFLSINAAAAWLPWMLYAGERLAREQRLRLVGMLGLVLGLQWLTGHAQVAWYSLILLALWIIFRARTHSSSSGRTILAMGLACGLGFAIAAAQLLPTLEYMSVSNRAAAVNREFALTYSFWPWRLLGLFAPDLYGNPRSGDFWGYGNFWEDAIYIGVLPFVLAIGALFSKRIGRLRWFLFGIAIAALVLALGQNTPVFVFLFDYVPTFSLFQGPTRWNIWLVMALSLLAGLGAEAWQVADGRRLYWLRLGTAGAGAVMLVSALLNLLDTGIEPTFTRSIAVAGFWLLASGILALLKSDPARAGWTTAVIAVVLLDLYFAGRGLNPTLPAEINTAPSKLSQELTGEQRLYMSSDLEREIKFDVAFTFDSFQPDFDWQIVRASGLPNTPVLDQLNSANNFDPILPERYVEWMNQLEQIPVAGREQWLARMNVGWQAEGNPMRYAPIRGPLRAWLVPQAKPAESASEAMRQATAPDFDPSSEVVLEGDFLAQSGGFGTVVSVKEESPTTLEIEVVAPDGGWLVVADSWYPGWEVELDGKETDAYPANGVMRASWVPAGEHSVIYRYRPTLLHIGLLLSAVGLATAVILRQK